MALSFKLISATVIGRDHTRLGRPNQDAYTIVTRSSDSLTVAVVADGCGESDHSEVGAQLGARLVANIILENASSAFSRLSPQDQSTHLESEVFWDRVRQDAVAELRVIVRELGSSMTETVSTFFLFTLVGVLITPQTAIFFSFGDGVLYVNGIMFPLGPFASNAPPYIGYDIVGTTNDFADSDRRFRVITSLPTDDLESFLIGSDGVDDLVRSRGNKVPGKDENVEDISTFWIDEKFFRNPALLIRRLRILNTEHQRPDWEEKRIRIEPGLLRDDTTIIVGRRKAMTDA